MTSEHRPMGLAPDRYNRYSLRGGQVLNATHLHVGKQSQKSTYSRGVGDGERYVGMWDTEKSTLKSLSHNVIVVTTEDVFLSIEVKCINLVHFEVKIKRFMDTAGKSCSTYAEPVRSAVTSSTKAAFCLFKL
ncbi:hypothetical protein OYC64_016214 [Pagothenia borchgrevinki]|uniref:Uncharacterized protein n=1 Tax=Pagothenia borchgrevinki TaxID=8213 RepID=A0ABD2HKC1_PAGBO